MNSSFIKISLISCFFELAIVPLFAQETQIQQEARDTTLNNSNTLEQKKISALSTIGLRYNKKNLPVNVEVISFKIGGKHGKPIGGEIFINTQLSSFSMGSSSNSDASFKRFGNEIVQIMGGIICVNLHQMYQNIFFNNDSGGYGMNFSSVPVSIFLNEQLPEPNTEGDGKLKLINRMNLYLFGAHNFKIPIEIKSKKEDIIFSVEGIAGYSAILHNYDHVYFEIFQDDFGNKAHQHAVICNGEISLIIKKFKATFGYVGRFSIGKGIQDAQIFGLKPRAYFSFEYNLF